MKDKDITPSELSRLLDVLRNKPLDSSEPIGKEYLAKKRLEDLSSNPDQTSIQVIPYTSNGEPSLTMGRMVSELEKLVQKTHLTIKEHYAVNQIREHLKDIFPTQQIEVKAQETPVQTEAKEIPAPAEVKADEKKIKPLRKWIPRAALLALGLGAVILYFTRGTWLPLLTEGPQLMSQSSELEDELFLKEYDGPPKLNKAVIIYDGPDTKNYDYFTLANNLYKRLGIIQILPEHRYFFPGIPSTDHNSENQEQLFVPNISFEAEIPFEVETPHQKRTAHIEDYRTFLQQYLSIPELSFPANIKELVEENMEGIQGQPTVDKITENLSNIGPCDNLLIYFITTDLEFPGKEKTLSSSIFAEAIKDLDARVIIYGLSPNIHTIGNGLFKYLPRTSEVVILQSPINYRKRITDHTEYFFDAVTTNPDVTWAETLLPPGESSIKGPYGYKNLVDVLEEKRNLAAQPSYFKDGKKILRDMLHLNAPFFYEPVLRTLGLKWSQVEKGL